MQLSRKTSDAKRILQGSTILSNLEIERQEDRQRIVREEEDNFADLFREFEHIYESHTSWTRKRRARAAERDSAMKSLAFHVQDHLRILKMNARRFGKEIEVKRYYQVPKEADRPRTFRDRRWFSIAENCIEGDARIRETDHRPVKEITGEDLRTAITRAQAAQAKHLEANGFFMETKLDLRRLREIYDRRLQKIRVMITCQLQEQQASREMIRNILRIYGYEYQRSDGQPDTEEVNKNEQKTVTNRFPDQEPTEKAVTQETKKQPAQAESPLPVAKTEQNKAASTSAKQAKADQPTHAASAPYSGSARTEKPKSKKKIRGKRNKRKAREESFLGMSYRQEEGDNLAGIFNLPPEEREPGEVPIMTKEHLDEDQELDDLFKE